MPDENKTGAEIMRLRRKMFDELGSDEPSIAEINRQFLQLPGIGSSNSILAGMPAANQSAGRPSAGVNRPASARKGLLGIFDSPTARGVLRDIAVGGINSLANVARRNRGEKEVRISNPLWDTLRDAADVIEGIRGIPQDRRRRASEARTAQMAAKRLEESEKAKLARELAIKGVNEAFERKKKSYNTNDWREVDAADYDRFRASTASKFWRALGLKKKADLSQYASPEGQKRRFAVSKKLGKAISTENFPL